MDSEDEYEETPSYRGVPATIVLINVFEPGSTKTAQVALAASSRMVRQYLRQSTSQCISVCLYGTEDADDVSKLGAKGVFDVFPLAPPTLGDFKKLQAVNVASIKQAKELIMSDALLHCSKMFASCKKVLSTRTIIILSRLEIPPVLADQKPALKKVEDLVDSYVELKLVNIAESEYQINDFYKDFLLEANKGKEVEYSAPIWSEIEIEKIMHQHSHRHLAVARLSFEIGNGINIGVGVYSLMKSQGQSGHKTSNLDRETNTVLSSVTKTMKVSLDTESGRGMDVDGNEQEPNQVLLHKSEVLYSQEYGGERVEFTADEMKALKNPFGPPMLKLLGFKPASLMCKEKWFFKRSYFLFPNDGLIEGSILAFKALHQACVETGIVAICVLCTRVNSRPVNVALSPCTNPLGLHIDTGFDVICIPFVENVRDLPSPEEIDDLDISLQKLTMKDIIENLKFTYKPDMFENPKLQSEYRAIEAIAFDDDDVEPFLDTTKPGSERFGDLDDELFYRVFGPFSAGPVKRPALPKDSSTSTAKKAKTYIEVDESLLQRRLQEGKLAQFTVVELKAILSSKNIPSLPALNGLKKAKLVELVEMHC